MIVVGILVGGGIIAGVSALEAENVITNSSSVVTTTQTTVSTSLQTTVQTNTQTTTTTKISNSSEPTGLIAVQIADPPNLPLGTTHLYVNYSDIEVQSVGAVGANPVWFTVAQNKEIDLLGVTNRSVTVDSTQVPVGNFNNLRIDISSVVATFGGKNYTVILPVSQIKAPIQYGGISLSANASVGVVLQLSPTLIAEQSNGSTIFATSFGAQAIQVPPGDWNPSLATTGSEINLSLMPWWNAAQIQISKNIVFISELMSYNSLLLVLKNTGDSSVSLSGVSIIKSAAASNVGSTNATQTVATFFILSNSSLVQPGPELLQIGQVPLGLTLRPNQTVNLLYVGQIRTMNSTSPPFANLSILPNEHYLLQVEGTFGSVSTINATYCCNVG